LSNILQPGPPAGGRGTGEATKYELAVCKLFAVIMNGGKTGTIFAYLYLFVTRNIAYFVRQIQQYEEIYFDSSF
jgi:hypothetical protein